MSRSTYSFQTLSLTDDNDGELCSRWRLKLDFNINPSAFEIQDDGIDQTLDLIVFLQFIYHLKLQ